MKKIFIAIFALTLLLFGCVSPKKEEFLVLRAIDGDTVELFGGEKVRLIGIDSTERGEECFKEAKEALAGLVNGKTVSLETDVEERDKYGRLLGYLYVGKEFVNLKMVEDGFAFAYEFEPNTRHSQKFLIAQERAKEGKSGCLWTNSLFS